MTVREQVDWIKTVVGKKLRWSNINDGYLVPDGTYHPMTPSSIVFGAIFYKDNTQERYPVSAHVFNGFESFQGDCWVLVDSPIKEEKAPTEKTICSCSSWTLFHFGCECGAFKKAG